MIMEDDLPQKKMFYDFHRDIDIEVDGRYLHFKFLHPWSEFDHMQHDCKLLG